MPFYEYECKNCGEKFDQFQSWQAIKEEAVCPKCGSSEVQRLFSPFGIGDFSDSEGCGSGSFG